MSAIEDLREYLSQWGIKKTLAELTARVVALEEAHRKNPDTTCSFCGTEKELRNLYQNDTETLSICSSCVREAMEKFSRGGEPTEQSSGDTEQDEHNAKPEQDIEAALQKAMNIIKVRPWEIDGYDGLEKILRDFAKEISNE